MEEEMGAGSEATPWGGPSSLLTHPLTPAEDASSKRRQPAQHGPVRALADQGDVGTGLVPPRGTGCLLPGAPAPGWPPGGAAETPQKHPLGARGLPRSCGPAEVPGRPPRVLPTLRGVSRALLGRTPWTQEQSRPLLHLSPSSVPYRQSLILCPLAKVGLQGHGDGPERADLSWEAVTRHPASPFVCPSARLPAAHTTALPCPRAADAGASCALVRAVRPPCLVDRLSHSASKVSF